MIKKFNGTDVVIMTVKQAEDINNKFTKLQDSLTQLNNELNGCITSLYFTQDKLETTNNDLNQTTSDLNAAKDSIARVNIMYSEEVKRQDKLEWIDKKARKNITIGLGATLVSWIVFAIAVIKQ